MAADGRNKLQNLIALAAERKRHKDILSGNHPEIAMHGLHGIKNDGPYACRRKNGAHLLGDVKILPDARDDNNAASARTVKNHLHGIREGAAY